MWRLRMFVQLLTLYFIWSSVMTSSNGNIYSYDSASIITYILGSSVIRAFVFSSQSFNVGRDISSGDLNNYLIKPIKYFWYWGARDLGDKLLNLVFSVFEIFLVLKLYRPNVIFEDDLKIIFLFLIFVILSVILYFLFSLSISQTNFWYYGQNGWAQRFLAYVVIETLGGSLFPIDLLPESILGIIKLLPTTYFLYFPLQIYLDRLSGSEIAAGFGMVLFWILFFLVLNQKLWHKGLKIYGAFGR